MLATLKDLFRRKPRYKPGPPPPRRFVITESCITALGICMAPEIKKGHEGVAYLLGQSDGTTTIAIAAIRPAAMTTKGSFNVPPAAMARVVRAAVDRGLQVIGQVHTHPGQAYHSDGDDDGAKIAFTGFISIVLPHYGRHLPSFTGAAAYVFKVGERFMVLDPATIVIVSGRIE